MTDIRTFADIYPGQLWEPYGYPGLQDEVLRLIPIDDEMHVVWRGPSSRPQLSTVADFVQEHHNPMLAVPAPHERVEFAAAVRDEGGGLYEMSPWPTIHEAYLRAVELRGFDAVVGMQKITTTQTYEWVEWADEAAS